MIKLYVMTTLIVFGIMVSQCNQKKANNSTNSIDTTIRIDIPLPKTIEEGKKMIENMVEKLRNDTSSKQPNMALYKQSALTYDKFAEAFPNDSQTIDYLFKSAELHRSLKEFDVAVTIYEKIVKSVTANSKQANCLFLMGFTYENELNQKEKAKQYYNEFLEKYPKHELIESVKFSLKNIDKPMEEIIKEFEQKNKINKK